MLGEFEKEGFAVEGANEVMDDLSLGSGPLGRVAPSDEEMADVHRALDVARAIGRLDVGQGAVVCRGLVLAVEAQEGTDAMLARVADLPVALRGQPGASAGVLAKAPKPIQETRIDLPTIGPTDYPCRRPRRSCRDRRRGGRVASARPRGGDRTRR
jgi:DUF1009 family protein